VLQTKEPQVGKKQSHDFQPILYYITSLSKYLIGQTEEYKQVMYSCYVKIIKC